MAETLGPQVVDGRGRLSRRQFLTMAGILAAADGYNILRNGIVLSPPAREHYVVTIGKRLASLSLGSNEKLVSKKTKESGEYFTTSGQIIIPSEQILFTAGEQIPTVHRSGNSTEGVAENVRDKIAGTDMDISVINGRAYDLHGSVLRIKIGKWGIIFPLIIDGDEKRIQLRFPPTFERRIKEIAKYNGTITDPDQQLKISAEAKNGNFTDKLLKDMCDTMINNGVAGVIFGGSIEQRVIAATAKPPSTKGV